EGRSGLAAAGTAMPGSFSGAATELRRATHKTVQGVTDDIARFHFNKAVARIHEFVNRLQGEKPADEGHRWALREAFETLARLRQPMVPHVAEEIWESLGHATMLSAGVAW